MASTGHSGTHTAQSMHSLGSMTRKLGPSRKASTGHTSTQSVYLQRMHASVTTKVMRSLASGLPWINKHALSMHLKDSADLKQYTACIFKWLLRQGSHAPCR